MKRLDNLIKSKFKEVKFNTPLKNFSSFRIGGNARYFFEASGSADLKHILSFAKKHRLRWFILGGGTNVLFGDVDYKGLVIHMVGTDIKRRGFKLHAEAGANLQKIVMFSVRAGLAGLENLSGIPGSVGGAVAGNAGTGGQRQPRETEAAGERGGYNLWTEAVEIGDVIESAKVFDARSGRIRIFKKRDLKFSYRNSLLKLRHNLILLSVVLRLKKAKNPDALLNVIKKASERRNITQPKGLSCGCVFMNPRKGNRGRFSCKRTVPLTAGELIDKAGLKGTRIGGAMISETHGNFFINTGGATSKDMIALINLAKKRVYEKFKIRLREEIKIV